MIWSIVGRVTWPVKISFPNDLYCVEWDVKPYSTNYRRSGKKGGAGTISPADFQHQNRITWFEYVPPRAGSWTVGTGPAPFPDHR